MKRIMNYKTAIKWIEDSYFPEDWDTNGYQEAIESLVKHAKKKRKLKEKFEEEFEDEMNIGESTEGALYPYVNNEFKFIDLFEKYLEIVCNGAPMKVKIKSKNGKIVIERIEE